MTNMRQRWLVSLLGLILFGSPGLAQVVDSAALKRQQAEQQRARTMTRELVRSVIDLQLQQLDENGLADLEIYQEIQQTRDQLLAVAETEMTDVVELLATAQKLPQEEREAAFTQARQTVRTIVLRLTAARQNLLRRMKVSELAEDVRRLIALQTNVHTATEELPAHAKGRQSELLLKSVEDQRDVAQLFQAFLDVLNDVRTWGGPLSEAASDGLNLVQTTGLSQHLDDAAEAIVRTDFPSALAQQEAGMRGLQELLALLLRVNGVADAVDQTATKKIEELSRRQQAIRDETQALDSAAPPPDSLVDRQTKLRQELAELDDLLTQPAPAAHLDQAKLSAEEAAAHLFENRREKAIAEQGNVLDHLAAMNELLKNVGTTAHVDRSAAELSQEARDLAAAAERIKSAQLQLQEPSRDPASNAPQEVQRVAEALAAVEQALATPALPKSTQRRLEDVKTMLAEATKNPHRGVLPAAREALERAAVTMAAALDNAQRKAAAVKIGELARAAEVLERAAAEERAIAEAVSAAENQSSQENAAEEAAKQQAAVATVAEKVAEGLAETAPQSAEIVREGQSAAQQSAASNETAAEKFSAAAQALREEMAATAEQFAKSHAAQSEKLATGRTAVEQALQQLETSSAEHQAGNANQDLSQQLAEQNRLAQQLADQTSNLDLGTFESLQAAQKIAQQGLQSSATPQQQAEARERAKRNLERAAANLAAKELAVRRSQDLAHVLADLVKEQEAAAKIIADQRAAAAGSALDSNALESLSKATSQFAETQHAIGQGAVELSQQAEVANQPLREALKLASQFPNRSPQEIGSQAEERGPAHHSMPEKRAPIPQTEFPDLPSDKAVADDTPLDTDPLGNADDIVLPVNLRAELGTGFVPKTPELTAKMMAGPEARSAMEAAELALNRAGKGKLSKTKRSTQPQSKRDDQNDAAAQPDDTPQETDGSSGAQLVANQGRASTLDNSALRDGALQRQREGTNVANSQPGAADGTDASNAARKYSQPPWFAKLPPELRQAIRANAQQRAPKSYEEKLKRYFESVE